MFNMDIMLYMIHFLGSGRIGQ